MIKNVIIIKIDRNDNFYSILTATSGLNQFNLILEKYYFIWKLNFPMHKNG